MPILISISLSSLSSFYWIFCSSRIAIFYRSISDFNCSFLCKSAFLDRARASARRIYSYSVKRCLIYSYLSLAYLANLSASTLASYYLHAVSRATRSWKIYCSAIFCCSSLLNLNYSYYSSALNFSASLSLKYYLSLSILGKRVNTFRINGA